ncbi:MAG: LysR family transcriptional regulator [Pseudomonadales bacterium]|nr:LysR family transcriptional regulator [Pseudomonadales bacterium]
MSNNSLSDMELFAAIVGHGGIRIAADHLSVTRSTLSRRLALMEERLGIRLIERNTRQFQITEAGLIYAKFCKQTAEISKQAEYTLANLRDQPSGLLRLTAPVNYGAAVLQPIVNNFIKAHKHIDVEIELSDAYLDIIDAGIDVALRLGPLNDSDMHARLIHIEKKRLCCSKAYAFVHGLPKNPYQLEDHDCIRYGRGRDELWHFKKQESISFKPKGRIIVNDISANRCAIMGDLGIGWLPGFLCQQEIDNGELVALLDDWIEADLPMYALYPKRDLMPKKVSVFIDFMTQALA